jgi:hypothetical protein
MFGQDPSSLGPLRVKEPPASISDPVGHGRVRRPPRPNRYADADETATARRVVTYSQGPRSQHHLNGSHATCR